MTKFYPSVDVMRAFLVLCFLGTSVSGLGQKTYHFESITVEDGLSQSSITSMAQDVSGYLWIGTQDGLNKYDGYSFKVYRSIEGDSASIPGNYVSKILIDSSNNIWVATIGNLSRYDLSTDAFKNYPLEVPGIPISPNIYINDIIQSRNGSLILATSVGVIDFDPATNAYTVRNEFVASLNRSATNYYETKTMGDWVFFTNGSMHKPPGAQKWVYEEMVGNRSFYDPKTERLFFYWMFQRNDRPRLIRYDASGKWVDWTELPDLHHTLEMCFTSDGDTWMGTDNGVFIYDPSDKLVTNISSYELSTSPLNHLRVIYETRDGVIWLGTNGYGLKKYNPQTNQFGYIGNTTTSPIHLSHSYVDAIYTPDDTTIYVTTPAGLDIINVFKKTTTHIQPKERLREIVADSKGQLWFMGFDNLWLLRNNKLIDTKFESSPSISPYPARPVAFVGGARLATLVDGKKKTMFDEPTPAIINVMQVIGDSLWVGTGPASSRILVFSISSRKVIAEFFHDPKDPKSFPKAGGVKCFFTDSKNRRWIGTSGGGVCLYNPVDKSFTQFIEADGLPNNVVYGILEDDSHNLWLSTNKGLCEFNPETKQVRNFEASDGLQSNEFNTGAYFKSKHGVMYFGGVNGLTYFNPATIDTRNTLPHSVISGFYVQEKLLTDYTGHVATSNDGFRLNLASDEHDFGFDFAGIGFSLPGRTKYRYMLENYDAQWHDVGNIKHINFTNIPPGNYVFRVKSSDPYGNWEKDGARVFVTIEAPFWGKPVVWLLSGIVVSVVLVTFYFVRVDSLKRKASHQQELLKSSIQTQETERKRISQDLHDELGAVLSISRMHLVQLREQYANGQHNLEASMVEACKLTEAALATMRRISHELMPPLLETFGLIKTLRSIVTQINDARKISVDLVVADEDLRWPTTVELGLYRICMEMINNTLKHANATHVTMHLMQNENGISFSYRDDGVGLPDSYLIGGGFRNIETRINIMGGIFTIDKTRSNGFGAEIWIPATEPVNVQ